MKMTARFLLGLALAFGVTLGQTQAQVAQPTPTIPPARTAPDMGQPSPMSMPKTAEGAEGTPAEDDLIIINGPNLGTRKKVAPTPAQLEGFYKSIWRKVGTEFNDPTKLTKKWAEWENKFAGQIKTVDDLDKALKQMVESLSDRWTTYTSLADMELMRQEHKDGIMSIGVLVRQHDGTTWNVDGLMFGSPAQQSSLREGDEVKAIIRDGKRQEMSALNTAEINKLLNGKAGEKVTVVAVWDKAEHEVELSFAAVGPDEVLIGMLPGKIGYIRLPTFVSEEVVGQFVQSLGQLYEASNGDLNGLVFDLRYNGGGLVNMSLLVSSLFIEQGTIVKTTTRQDRSVTETSYKVIPLPEFLVAKMPKQATQFQQLLQTVPIVILTNGSTASASEITTGALRANKRAYVIGTKTFGKAVGFQVSQLANGGVLQITSLNYLTPAGVDIGGKGFAPDKVVEQPREGAEDDMQLVAAHEHLMAIVKQRADEMRDARDGITVPLVIVEDPGVQLHGLHYALIGIAFLTVVMGVLFVVARLRRKSGNK